MSEALVASHPASLLTLPWRDPHAASVVAIAAYIASLEQACLEHPSSADLRTALGIAHAVNHDVYKSMDALEAAVSLDPENFWANYKYAELHYRLRILTRAEELTVTALNLATNNWQLAIARKQLLEIRTASRGAARNLSWKMPILGPVLGFSATLLVVAAAFMWM